MINLASQLIDRAKSSGLAEQYLLMIVVAITDIQISPVFSETFPREVSYGTSPQALSNGTCNTIIGKTVTKPHPPKLRYSIQAKMKL